MLSPWQLAPEDQMPMGAGVFPLPGGFDPRNPSSGYGGHAVDAQPTPMPQPAGPGGASGYPYADEPQLPAYHTPQHQEYKPHGFWEGLENMVHGVNVSGSGPGALIAAAVALGLNSKLKSVSKRRTDTEEANAGIDSSAKVNADREEKQYGERMKDWTERRVRAIEASKQPRAFAWQTATPAERQTHLDEVGAEARARAAGTSSGSPDDELMSDDTLQMLAERAYAGGGDPTLGMKNNSNRTRYFNMLRKLVRGSGGTGADLVTNKAGAEGDRKSLALQIEARDATKSFATSVRANAKQFFSVAKKVIDTGVPWANKPLRYIDKTLLGSGDQAAYDMGLNVIVPEFARINNSPSLKGQLSDHARQELEKAMGGDLTLGQIARVLKVLDTDAQNRLSAQEAAIAEINTRLRSRQPTGGEKADAGAGKFRYDPATGTLVPK